MVGLHTSHRVYKVFQVLKRALKINKPTYILHKLQIGKIQ